MKGGDPNRISNYLLEKELYTMATVYEIVQGLSQAAANAYDGAMTEDGEPIKAGLKREEGNPLMISE